MHCLDGADYGSLRKGGALYSFRSHLSFQILRDRVRPHLTRPNQIALVSLLPTLPSTMTEVGPKST